MERFFGARGCSRETGQKQSRLKATAASLHGFAFLNVGSDRGSPASGRIVVFRPSSSARPTTFVSPHSGACAPQRSAAVGWASRSSEPSCVFVRQAVVPSRAAMAWLRRSRSAFSSVRIVSSVKGGSSHCAVDLRPQDSDSA